MSKEDDLLNTQSRMKKIARLNANDAFDRKHEYRNIEECFASYLINCLDTMQEEGIHRASRTVMVLFFFEAFRETFKSQLMFMK